MLRRERDYQFRAGRDVFRIHYAMIVSRRGQLVFARSPNGCVFINRTTKFICIEKKIHAPDYPAIISISGCCDWLTERGLKERKRGRKKCVRVYKNTLRREAATVQRVRHKSDLNACKRLLKKKKTDGRVCKENI